MAAELCGTTLGKDRADFLTLDNSIFGDETVLVDLDFTTLAGDDSIFLDLDITTFGDRTVAAELDAAILGDGAGPLKFGRPLSRVLTFPAESVSSLEHEPQNKKAKTAISRSCLLILSSFPRGKTILAHRLRSPRDVSKHENSCRIPRIIRGCLGVYYGWLAGAKRVPTRTTKDRQSLV